MTGSTNNLNSKSIQDTFDGDDVHAFLKRGHLMWIEKITNSKGTRYKYRERFTAANGSAVVVSITLNSNSTRAKKQAADTLREKFFKK